MILHFSHIGFTDGRTFMFPFGSVTSEPALAAAVGCRYRFADARTETPPSAQTGNDSTSAIAAGGPLRPRRPAARARA
jgi:hypothetical protein